MERVRKFVDELSVHELLQLQQDLNNDSKYLKHIVEAQLKHVETSNCKVCAHCGSDVVDAHHNNFTLVFGASDFRKKATLCGLDCMQQFTRKLEEMERKSLLKEE